MKIQVTQEDIDKGLAGRLDACPVALAIKRTTNYQFVKVTSDFIDWIDREDRWMTLSADHSVKHFISKFDKHKSVEPFSFDLYHSGYKS